MFASAPRHRLVAAALIGALSLATPAFAASITDPAAVIVPAKAAESQLRPKAAPKPAVAKPAPPTAKAEPEAEAAPAATGYLCLSNSCAKVAMLPMRSEADQAADAEAEAEAAVMSAATQIAGRLLSLSFTADDGDDEADVVLTPVADDEE